MKGELQVSRYQSWFSGGILSTIIFSRALSAYVGCAPQYRSFIVPSCLNYLIGLWHFTTPVNRHTRNTRESRFGNSRFVTLPSCFRFCKNAMKFTARSRSNWGEIFILVSCILNEFQYIPISKLLIYPLCTVKKNYFLQKNDRDNYSYNLHLTVWSMK